jgi:two-component system sensor kinase FixL
MSPVTIVWSMVASCCLTLSVINVLVWVKNRAAWANLFFSLTAASMTVFTFFELWMMRAGAPAEFATAIRWAHVPLLAWIISLTWFVRSYLGAGRVWLAWTACGLRALSLLPNFLTGQNLNYLHISSLRQIPFLGEYVSIPEGAPNPWMLAGQLAILLLIIFIADASVAAWRTGSRRNALLFGASIEFFLVIGLGQAVLLFWFKVQAPIIYSVPALGMLAVMAYGLSNDVLRASTLVGELQKSEAALRESTDRMTLAAEATHLGLWIRYLKLNEIWANEVWRNLFGFDNAQQLDLDCILQRVHPEDREDVQARWAMAIEGAGSYESEYRVVLPGGRTRWLASRGRVEFHENLPVLSRGVLLDITDRKQAEQETDRLRLQIAHVGRVSMMGQLASALAHEINQPLGSILRNAEAAEIFLLNPSPDLEEIRAILADIRKDDQRAGYVIDRMRGMLKRDKLITQPLQVSELVNDVVTLVKSDAIARRLKLFIEVPDDLPRVCGDRVQLQQVLLNLVLNGLDSVNVSAGENRFVRLSARLDEAQAVEIAVADTGEGIPAEKLQQVFDPFFTTKPNGMGMGLPISRTIIEAHRGQLWAENNNGGGAVFRFTLPITERSAAL